MRMIVIAAVALSFTSPALADVCNWAPEIVNCYHPTANFTGCQQQGPNGPATIFFRGALTNRPYQMDVVAETANGFGRIILLGDNAVIPPKASCPLSNWQPMGQRF